MVVAADAVVTNLYFWEELRRCEIRRSLNPSPLFGAEDE